MKVFASAIFLAVCIVVSICAPGISYAYNLPSYTKIAVTKVNNVAQFSFFVKWDVAPGFNPGQAVEFEIHIDDRCLVMPPGGKDNDVGRATHNFTEPGIGAYTDVWNYWLPTDCTAAKDEIIASCPGVLSAEALIVAQFVCNFANPDPDANFAFGLRNASKLTAGKLYHFFYPLELAKQPEAPSCAQTSTASIAAVRVSTFPGLCTLPPFFPQDCPYFIGASQCLEANATSTAWQNNLCLPTSAYEFVAGDNIDPVKGTCVDKDKDGYFLQDPTLFHPVYGTEVGDCNDTPGSGSAIHNELYDPNTLQCNYFPCALGEVCNNGNDDDCDGQTDCADWKCATETPCCGIEGASCCAVGSACIVAGLNCDATNHCVIPQDPCFGISCADDGNACNGPEHCSNGVCISGPPLASGKWCAKSFPQGAGGINDLLTCLAGQVTTVFSCPNGCHINPNVNDTCENYCGDGVCGLPDTCVTCPQDCGNCPTCSDGIKNQNETGVDCGGPCPPCPHCPNGICEPQLGENCPSCWADCCLPAPTLISPPNGVVYQQGTSIVFSWSAVPGAKRYKIAICPDQTLTNCQVIQEPDVGITQWPTSATSMENGFWSVSAIPWDETIGWGNFFLPPRTITVLVGGDGTPEICNGFDDNGNGSVDEGDPGGGAFCSTGLPGVCGAGHQHCLSGNLSCAQDVQSSPEVCGNGLDDDCDGFADNNCGVCVPGEKKDCYTGPPNTMGVGICKAGNEQCWFGGVWSGVCGNDVTPQLEVCNGLDDNCNGQIDEGNPGGGAACATGQLGVCSGGSTHCQGGAFTCQADASPSPELCNGVDDNCNGQVDEGFNLTTNALHCGSCGNACLPFQWCAGGMCWSPELCNGLDDDGDGIKDNGNPGGGGPCITGQPGVCSAGTFFCGPNTNGAFVCLPTTNSSPEICDGQDNDCNGVIDNGNPGSNLPCNTGLLGACTTGHTVCQNGALACVQNVQPSAETCDGIDNNCNGQADDGNPGGNLPCNTGNQGVCSAGTTSCTGGQIVCNPNVQAGVEICDNKDNNCNGQVDEGCGACVPGAPAACYSGSLGTQNVGLCHGGTRICDATGNWPAACPGEVVPSPEICDGSDNDCNGVVDNGNPGGNQACNTGLLGVCVAGHTACQGGALACLQNVLPSAETCDGIDNNCNGQADDGNPGGGLACNTGLLGACAAGHTVCQNGFIACVQNVQPSAEVCDGLDNDCNGQIDNGLGACVYDIVVRCVPKPGWSVNYANYYAVPPIGPWDSHEQDHTDSDPGPAFETHVALQPGWRLEITHNLTDPNGTTRWSCDFSTDPTGSGAFGVTQCDVTVTVNGAPTPLSFAANPFNPSNKPWCWYANLNVMTPTAAAPLTLCQ